MSNIEFTELDAHRVITMSLNKIANFRMQRGGPKLFKDLLVANLIQKAKILVVDEFYSSSRSLTLDNNDSDLPETNLETENDVFEELEETENCVGQGSADPRLEISFSLPPEETKLGDNKDDVIVEEVCKDIVEQSSKDHPNLQKERQIAVSQTNNPNWDENNKENEPLLGEISTAQLDNVNEMTNKFSTLDSLEFYSRSNSPDFAFNCVKEGQLNSGNNLEDNVILLSGMKRKNNMSEEDCENIYKKSKRNDQLCDSFGRKWRASSLTRMSPHRTKRNTLKRHRSREWSITSFDTDSDDDDSFTDLKPFLKLKLKEGHYYQPSALIDNSVINHKTLRTDEEQIAILSTVFSSSFNGLGLQQSLEVCPTVTTFTFTTTDNLATLELKKTNSVPEVCSKQAKIRFRRSSQSSDHVAAVTA